jgi:prevent-host-death family protein
MLSLHNIHPLTDFKRNASTYIDQVRKTLAPVVLTVNGQAAVVVQDAGAYQAMIDRLQVLEQELHSIKQASLPESSRKAPGFSPGDIRRATDQREEAIVCGTN